MEAEPCEQIMSIGDFPSPINERDFPSPISIAIYGHTEHVIIPQPLSTM